MYARIDPDALALAPPHTQHLPTQLIGRAKLPELVSVVTFHCRIRLHLPILAPPDAQSVRMCARALLARHSAESPTIMAQTMGTVDARSSRDSTGHERRATPFL